MIKKLALDVEDLVVEQFEVDVTVANTRGSVHGHHGETFTDPCICPILPATAYYYDTHCCTG
jgi:hypothetical protein